MKVKWIQKRITQTIVSGFELQEGQPVPVQYQLDGKFGDSVAQSVVRREHPSFSLVESSIDTITYRMSVETFIKHAEKMEETNE